MGGLRYRRAGFHQRSRVGLAASFRPAHRPIWRKPTSRGVVDAKTAWRRGHACLDLVRNFAPRTHPARVGRAAQSLHRYVTRGHTSISDRHGIRALLCRERKTQSVGKLEPSLGGARIAADGRSPYLARPAVTPKASADSVEETVMKHVAG